MLYILMQFRLKFSRVILRAWTRNGYAFSRFCKYLWQSEHWDPLPQGSRLNWTHADQGCLQCKLFLWWRNFSFTDEIMFISNLTAKWLCSPSNQPTVILTRQNQIIRPQMFKLLPALQKNNLTIDHVVCTSLGFEIH